MKEKNNRISKIEELEKGQEVQVEFLYIGEQEKINGCTPYNYAIGAIDFKNLVSHRFDDRNNEEICEKVVVYIVLREYQDGKHDIHYIDVSNILNDERKDSEKALDALNKQMERLSILSYKEFLDAFGNNVITFTPEVITVLSRYGSTNTNLLLKFDILKNDVSNVSGSSDSTLGSINNIYTYNVFDTFSKKNEKKKTDFKALIKQSSQGIIKPHFCVMVKKSKKSSKQNECPEHPLKPTIIGSKSNNDKKDKAKTSRLQMVYYPALAVGGLDNEDKSYLLWDDFFNLIVQAQEVVEMVDNGAFFVDGILYLPKIVDKASE